MAGQPVVPAGPFAPSVATPFFEVAVHCDRAADDVLKLDDKVDNLESMVAGAWKGTAANSLANSLVDKATLVRNAAGMLRSAAANLRRGGAQLAKAQAEATERQARRGW